MALTDLELKKLKHDPTFPKGRKVADQKGLYVFVTPTGIRSWRYAFRFGGKQRTLVIGTYPEVSLKEAHIVHEKARHDLAAGIDPAAKKQLAVETLGDRVFEKVARQLHQEGVRERGRAGGWVAEYATDFLSSLERLVFPDFGRLNLEEITPARIALTVDKISSLTLRSKMLQRIGNIFGFAAEKGLHDQDPTFLLRKNRRKPVSEPMPAIMTIPELVECLQRVDEQEGAAVHKLALRFVALTTARVATVCGARWDELHLKGNRWLWIVPKHRMKMRKAWACPLSDAALEVIEALRPYSGRGEYIFGRAADTRRAIHSNSLSRLMVYAGFKGVHSPHRFRHSFSTVMNNHYGERRDNAAIEKQLAHDQKGTAGIYNQAEYLERRTALMDEWAGWLQPLVKARDIRDGTRGRYRSADARRAA